MVTFKLRSHWAIAFGITTSLLNGYHSILWGRQHSETVNIERKNRNHKRDGSVLTDPYGHHTCLNFYEN